MKKIIDYGPIVLMFLYLFLDLFQERLNISQTQLLIVLSIISVICIIIVFVGYKKSGNKKLALLESIDYIVFIVLSLLETFGVIEIHTYITVLFIAESLEFSLERIIKGKQEQPDRGRTD